MEKLENFLREKREDLKQAYLQGLYRRNGVHPILRRSNVVITNEMVQQLREEIGV